MRIASVQNQNVYRNNMVQNNNTNNHSPKMKISMNHSSLNTPKAHNPSFGWFIIDDLFFYFRDKKMNKVQNEQRLEQIRETNQKVVDDITLLSQKFRIPMDVAKAKYENYLNIGGITPSKDGMEVGLNKVIGYSKEKLDLIEKVVTPIVAHQTAIKNGEEPSDEFTIPNGIILYGPYGRGKSFMAESFIEHFEQKAKKENLNIKVKYLSGRWQEGDTDKNANMIYETFQKAKKDHEETNCHTVIYIENLDSLIDEDDKPLLSANFLCATANCKNNGITWVGTIGSPKIQPNWLFNPIRTNTCVQVSPMSDPEISALMSYFWAQHNRKDDSEHSKILEHLNKIGLQLNPPQFKEIAKNVDEKLSQKDYNKMFRGEHKEPVKTQDVISAINEYQFEYTLGGKSNIKGLSTLEGLNDNEYIVKIQEKYNENK